MDFTCDVCGVAVRNCPAEDIDREVVSCRTCRSTVRMRSVVHLLSTALFGKSMPIAQFPTDRKIVGLGLSDWPGYADLLAKKLRYTNTYFHQAPFFDIAAPAGERVGTCDFLISSDLFEHVAPPIQRAFSIAFEVLKPGGHLILTVPFGNGEETAEHYPELHDYRVVQLGEESVLVNRTLEGRYTVQDELVFHGGSGTTLEMRVFCRRALEAHLASAGFTASRVFAEDIPEWGILHKHPWSLPILARRPK